MVEALTQPRKNSPPALLGAYAVGFSLFHLYALLHGWYYAYPWLDMPVHIAGGILVAWVAIWFRHRIRGFRELPILAQVLGVLAAVALVGVLWELWEALADAIRILHAGVPLGGIPDAFGRAPYNDRWDTLLDLFNDLVGAGIASVVWVVVRKARRRS